FRRRAGLADGPKAPSAVVDQPEKPSRGDRFRVLNSFVDVSLRELTPAEVKVWLVLYRDTRDGVARVAQADVAVRAGLSTRGVRKGLAGLARRGLVEVLRRGRRGRGRRSTASGHRLEERWFRL